MPILQNPRDVTIQNSSLFDVQGDLIINSKVELTYLKPYTLLRPRNFRDFAAECRVARLEGTCEWSTRHPLILEWLHSDTIQSHDEPRLWLHGGPGTGKSVLAAYLMEKKKEIKSQDEIVLCAFCGVQGGIRPTSGSIALGFLRQCLEEYPESFEKHIFDRLYRIIWDARDGRIYTMDQLRSPLFSILRLFKKICFIIDGIDECETEVFERRGILDAIFHENQIPSMFLFSGRREAAVVKRLKDFPQVEIGSNETTQGDIQALVNTEVDGLASEYPECKASKELLKEGLLRGAGGMFLWVKLKVDVIRGQLPCSPAVFKKVVEDIDTVPKGLNSLYEESFSQKCSRWNESHEQIAVRTLQWLLYSRAPISENLLGVVVAIDADNGDLLEDNIETSIKTTVNHLLGALVGWRETDDGIPYATLIHYSLREYLLSTSLPTQNPSQISPERLFKTCCAILCSPAVREPLKQYYNSVDKRRSVIKIPLRDPIEYRDTRLQRLLCHKEDWGRWRERQLMDFVEERRCREREEKRVQAELDEFRDMALPQFIENQENYLRLLRKMRDDEPEDSRKLIITPGLLERELMVYALKFLPSHLADILESAPVHPIHPIINSLAVFVEDLEDCVSRLRANKEDPPFPRITNSLAIHNLSTTLCRVEETNNAIRRLVHGDQPKSYMHMFRTALWQGIPTIHPEKIWTDRALQLFEGADHSTPLARTFELITLVIKDLRDIEQRLHASEDHTGVVPGSTFLVHTLRHTGHTLALWVMAHAYMYGELKGEIVKALQDDSYLHPDLLQIIKVTTPITPLNIEIPPVGFDIWNYYAIGFSFVLAFFSIVGVLFWY